MAFLNLKLDAAAPGPVDLADGLSKNYSLKRRFTDDLPQYYHSRKLNTSP